MKTRSHTPLDLQPRSDIIFVRSPLEELRECGASLHQCRDMQRLFRASVSDSLKELAEALRHESGERAIRDIIHRARSSCSTIGAVGLKDSFLQFSDTTDTTERRALLKRMDDLLVDTCQSIETFLNDIAD